MAYPLVNGAAINGEDGGFAVASLHPVVFGTPLLSRGYPAQSLAPVSFSEDSRIRVGVDIRAAAFSISPVSFGIPSIIQGGFIRSDRSFPALSLSPVRFGSPALQAPGVEGAVHSLSPVVFSRARARWTFSAASMSPVTFSASVRNIAAAASTFRPVRFGRTAAAFHFRAASLHSVPRFGSPRALMAALRFSAGGVAPVTFGIPGPARHVLYGRSIYPVRFCAPTIDRGSAC